MYILFNPVVTANSVHSGPPSLPLLSPDKFRVAQTAQTVNV